MTLLQFILIQANLVLLFGLYKWFAAKNGQYSFNRWYLLLAPLAAVSMPFLVLERSSTEIISVLLPAIEVIEDVEAVNAAVISWTQVAIAFGALSVMVLFAISLWKLLKTKRAVFMEEYKGVDVYQLTSEEATTHSLFNRIYLHPSHSEYKNIVLEHEYAHCKSRHSWDLVLMSLYKALFWFNPVIYKWAKEMQLNHEYLADAYVLSSGVSPKTYGATLLALNFSHSGGSLVHSFNEPSSLRKRIVHFKHQNKFNMKHILLLSAVAALAFGTMSMVSTSPSTSKNLLEVSVADNPGEDEITQPQYPGGKDELMKYLVANIQYPESLKEEKAAGKVFVQFTINVNGKVESPKVVRSSGYDEMDSEAVRVITKMPNWKPGTKNGENVAAQMTLPIVFKM